jgi:hypothetical protein
MAAQMAEACLALRGSFARFARDKPSRRIAQTPITVSLSRCLTASVVNLFLRHM